jgi:hypothetical protein
VNKARLASLEARAAAFDPLANKLPIVAVQYGDRYQVGEESMSTDELAAYLAPFEARGLPGIIIDDIPREEVNAATA